MPIVDTFVARSFQRAPLVVALVLAAAVSGVLAARDLRRDVFPDLAAPVFNVIVQNAAMGAEELETAIAVPLETALAGLPDVRRIRSTSQLGVTQVTVEFEAHADYHRARQLVAERMAQAASQLPPGTDPPTLSSLTGRLNEILELTLEARPGAADLMTLRDLAELEVKNRLLAVPGVAAVEILGGYLREFQILLDPDRLAARGVTLDEVMHAAEGANLDAAGGFVARGPTEWSVRALGRAHRVEDIRTTVVAMRGGTSVTLGDVAEVRQGPAVRRGIAHRLRGEVVSCRLVKQFGADTVQVAAGARRALADLAAGLPHGVTLRVVYDQADLVRASLGGLGRAVLAGAAFVVLVIFLLMGDLRAALVVTATIPLSLALAALVLQRIGVGLNTMTLGGLAVAVGLLVDASIIVTENVVHRLALSRAPDRMQVVAAVQEVGRPIAYATLIVVAVFAPLLGMTGIEGRMYQPLAAAVIASVLAALTLSLTLVPLMASALIRRRRPRDGASDPGADADDPRAEPWLLRRIKAGYQPLLAWCMRRAGLVRLATLGLTVPALALAFTVGTDFMPQIDEGALLLQTVLPAEASLDEVDRLNHRVEDVLRKFPEVEDVVRRTGRAERTEDPMPHTMSDVLVVLQPERQRPREDLEQAMRAALAKVPGVSVLFTTPLGMRIDEGLGGTPADLAVRIFGPDLAQLAQLAERAERILTRVPGLEDLRAERLGDLPQLRVNVDRAAVARVGLTPGDVIRAVRIGLVGEQVSEVWVGQRRFALVVRLQDERRNSADAIRGLLIDGHDGTRIPLGQLATLEEAFGAGSIRREAGSRRVAVEASVAGRDLGSAAADVQRALTEQLTLPPGYFLDVGGRVESQARAARSLTLAIALALVAVFALLYLALGSLAEVLVVLATLPDALVGGILALLIAGETWNVSSLVGLIALLGIAVQNGLVLVTQTRRLTAAGIPFPEALAEASLGRVRPKLMTAATAILGLLPLLVLPLHGTEIERPLAVVMIGGLVTSTLFTLLALPTFYMLVHQLRARAAAARSRPAPGS
jgi:cobalt-zinc-cadmium resistance protein CzcA